MEATPPDIRLTGTVQSITYFGSIQRVIVNVADAPPLEVDVDSWRNKAPLHEGQKVDLLWQDDAAVKLKTDA